MSSEGDSAAERDAIEALAATVRAAMPDGFTTGILRVSSLAPTSMLTLEVRDGSGGTDWVRTRGPFSAQARELREVMFRPGVGT